MYKCELHGIYGEHHRDCPQCVQTRSLIRQATTDTISQSDIIKKLRWEAACMAMQSLIGAGSDIKGTAEYAFKFADAMLQSGGYDAPQD